MTENPYESPQAELVPPAAPELFLIDEPEEPKARPIFRLIAIVIGYITLSTWMEYIYGLQVAFSMESVRNMLTVLMLLASSMSLIYLGIAGRMPSFSRRKRRATSLLK